MNKKEILELGAEMEKAEVIIRDGNNKISILVDECLKVCRSCLEKYSFLRDFHLNINKFEGYKLLYFPAHYSLNYITWYQDGIIISGNEDNSDGGDLNCEYNYVFIPFDYLENPNLIEIHFVEKHKKRIENNIQKEKELKVKKENKEKSEYLRLKKKFEKE